MPLWFHPVPVPVDLGVPVYPSPLLYHPPPVLIDPRPVVISSGLYCTCQSSRPISHPPAPHPDRAGMDGVSAVIRSTRLRKVRELEWEYDDFPCSEVRVMEVIGPTSSVNIRFGQRARARNTRRHGGLAPEPIPEPPVPELSQHSAGCRLPPAPEPRVAVTEEERVLAQFHREVDAKARYEGLVDENVRVMLRAEIKREMEEENMAMRMDLARREREVEKRAEDVRKKEKEWIATYGKGIIEGGRTAGEPSSFRPEKKYPIPVDNNPTWDFIPYGVNSTQMPTPDRRIPTTTPHHAPPFKPTYRFGEDPFAPRPGPPAPTVCTLSTTSGEENDGNYFNEYVPVIPEYRFQDLDDDPNNVYKPRAPRWNRETEDESAPGDGEDRNLVITVSCSVDESESESGSKSGGCKYGGEVPGGKKVRWEIVAGGSDAGKGKGKEKGKGKGKI